MEIQRLRNITTGRLHTEMSHIYQDLDHLTGMGGVMTHMIPNVMSAMKPWLVAMVEDAEFWDGEHRPELKGDYPLEPMNDFEREEMVQRYSKLPHPFTGKQIS